jgi:hypothetical protein
MSWFDDLVDLGKSAVSWFTGDSIGAKLAKTAITGYTLNRVTSSINKDNAAANKTSSSGGGGSGSAPTPDPGSRIQVKPNLEQKIPVVYGTATLGGIVTDAFLSDDNQLMYFCITLSEKTGNLAIGQGAASEFHLDKLYWNGLEVVFQADGQSFAALKDTEGNVDNAIDNRVAVWFYDGNSSLGKKPTGYSGVVTDARLVMPHWTTDHAMYNLCFAVVTVLYDKERGITNLGDMRFKLRNTMTEPGDVIYDYMTNPVYGAGIPPEEINGL